MTLRTDVSVLYCDRLGPYPKLVADCWDEARDARGYEGPYPVVCHPPCGPWSTLRTLSRETTADLGVLAVGQVRRFGGVLEHPAGSGLFEACMLPEPGDLIDGAGGYTFSVDQCDWGHVARKRTWLYLVGVPFPHERPPRRKPTHWCSGVQTPGARGKPPPGVKICSSQQRRRTPPAFAAWLAAQARRTGAA